MLVQFWDEATLPSDVQACVDSWRLLDQRGFRHILFDDTGAKQYIAARFPPTYSEAFARCSHPAMRADYFRLAYISREGGFYVDADDVFIGAQIDELFSDGDLKLHPLCYSIPEDAMADALTVAALGSDSDRVFYVNNDPMIAPPRHPVVVNALQGATRALLSAGRDDRDIQSLTGPGNLTATLVSHAVELRRLGRPFDFSLLRSWDAISRSEWELEYRESARDWRKWARRDFEQIAGDVSETAP
ncbi:hypothetical protein LLS1_01720 [Leifsonia sp. LS1]|nr:hypothetical protein LLS1_01720 [Leifsonia sp. LS1]